MPLWGSLLAAHLFVLSAWQLPLWCWLVLVLEGCCGLLLDAVMWCLFFPYVLTVLFSLSSGWVCPCVIHWKLGVHPENRPFILLASASLVYLFNLVARVESLFGSLYSFTYEILLYFFSIHLSWHPCVSRLTSLQAFLILASISSMDGTLSSLSVWPQFSSSAQWMQVSQLSTQLFHQGQISVLLSSNFSQSPVIILATSMLVI